MAADETVFKPGDTDNNLLRKILTVLIANGSGGGGGGGGGGGAVTIADGADVTQGARADAAVVNPALSASEIALLKGILTETLGVNTSTGGILNPAVTDPTSGATVISILKGLLTDIGQPADAAVTNPASSASVVASLKGNLTASNTTNTNLGAVADAAVTNPASSASVIAALKGALSLLTTNNNVGGYSTAIKDTTAVSTSPAYTAGDAVGGKRTITGALRTSGGTGILDSIVLLDRANQKAAMELFIFDSDPTNATITDNAAFVFSTDDLKVLARIPIAATDYTTINSKAIVTLKGLGVVLKGNATSTLYAALVTSGTPTYAATTDVQIIYGILQD